MVETAPKILKTRCAATSGGWLLCGAFARDSTPQHVEVGRVPFRIGRRPDVELSLASSVVSGLHAEILEQAGVLFIRDCGSTNGTFVNGRRISSDTLLSEGDWIEVGDVHLKVDSRLPPAADPSGRQVFQRTSQFDTVGRQQSSRGLLQLLHERRLEACFQPIHRLDSHEIYGYEYLARSTVDGVQTPGQMFVAAEACGREVELSLLCREMGVAYSVGLPAGLPLFLNTHPAEPLLEAVVPQLQQLRDQFPGRPLVLELHEAAITEPGLVRNVRAALQEIGVQLAFDDFGSGQARIRELICAPSDFIKFDAALIRDLQDVSRQQFRLFQSIISGVQGEGAITVAEGVETEQMIELCAETGFDLLQGYALSRPAIIETQPKS